MSGSATNGLSHSSASGALPRAESTSRLLDVDVERAATCQNWCSAAVPIDSTSTITNVTTVAVWVRLTSAETNSPMRAHAEGEREQEGVRAHQVLRPDAAEDEHEAGQRDRRDDQQEDVGRAPRRACR